MKKVHVLQNLSWLIIVISCQSALDPNEYVEWVEDVQNGWRVIETRGQLGFDIQCQPEDYLRLKTNGETKFIPDSLQMAFFEVSIRSASMGEDWLTTGYSGYEIQQRIYYFAYLFEQDIFLDVNGERTPCRVFHFERAASPGVAHKFLIGFQTALESRKTHTLVMETDFLSTLPLRFRFSPKPKPRLKGK
jgi:hypothetical protein